MPSGPCRPTPSRRCRQLRSRGRLRGVVALLGPAFVAAVAYVDPGNFATNFTAGAKFGYTLVWVIVVANLMAMLVQYLVGQGRRRHRPGPAGAVPRAPARGRCPAALWVQAEIIAMATDLAEFVGAAVGLYLLFGVPLFPAGLITAVVAFGILALEQRGYRRFELAIVGLLGIVFLGFLYDLLVGRRDPAGLAGRAGPALRRRRQPAAGAAGIIGATVMPHVVYLHSALTKSPGRLPGRRRAARAAALPAPRRDRRPRRGRR